MKFPSFLRFLTSMPLAIFCSTASSADRVSTEAGIVEGTSDEGIRIFKGIPYAAPPVGDLRWREPQPAPRWEGVRPATEFGAHPIQAASFEDMIFRDSGPSEDCLSLNVWTPAVEAAAKLPVMVWIYGGGFAGGGSSEARQDGRNLAKKGVIVVSMNYRLGVFGFFSHPELTRESEHHASGNYGLLDQAAALAWVHRNIAAFGGDPERVTVFGESAGSFSVCAQMASPRSRDLLHGAIGQSGALFGDPARTLPLDQAEANGVKFAKRLGAETIAGLRAKSTDEILKASLEKESPRFGPNLDGWFMAKPVQDTFRAGEQARIPLLAGWTADEKGPPSRHQTTVEKFAELAKKMFGADAEKFLTVYPAASDAEASVSAAALEGDMFIAFSTWRWIEAQNQTGGKPVYRYRFDRPPPQPEGQPSDGAYHAGDIEYGFNNLAAKHLTFVQEDRQLADLMSSYWTNFAKTGDPNGEGWPRWPRYDALDGYQVMHLDTPAKAAPDAQRARYQFLDTHSPWVPERK